MTKEKLKYPNCSAKKILSTRKNKKSELFRVLKLFSYFVVLRFSEGAGTYIPIPMNRSNLSKDSNEKGGPAMKTVFGSAYIRE